MDDFQMEDPRKHSAKQISQGLKNKPRKRTFLQYLFDLFVKTLILFSILALNFTLFANAGSYNLFMSSVEPMPEAFYIYAGLGVLSFVVMFFCSWCKPLENIVLSLTVSLFCIAVVNQFATFDKKSGLLIAFNGLFNDEINAALYEYSFLVIGVIVFVVTWIVLHLLSRSFLFYSLLLLVAVLVWTLSEAYLNTSVKYYRVVASSPALRSETIGKNLVFLSFRDLTTPNNLRKMAKDSNDQKALDVSVKNVLGFYLNNQFTLYPNALQQSSKDSFINLIASYNPDAKDEAASYIQSTAIREGYFNFESLQSEKKFMKQNSLYDLLRKGGYSITVYQSPDLDTCYVNSKLAVSTCKEKISVPMTMSSEYFSVIEKTRLLASQWLISTGFVSSLDSVLQMIGYVYSFPGLAPLSFRADNVSVVNSYKALEQIADSLDNQNGNQAYFAVIDLPSETYVYDEFCQMKPMAEWMGEKDDHSKKSLDVRRDAYAQQVSCLYGYLEKFMQQLDNSGMLENTTIVIEGLNNPLGLNRIDNDYYAQLQNKTQVSVAVRRPNSQKSQVDYSVCTVGEILNSIFFTHKPCKEFEGMVMADKLATEVKQQVEAQKYSPGFLENSRGHFINWFSMWGIKNQFGKPLEERKVPKTVYENTLDMEIETTDDSSESENLEKAEMGDDVLNDDEESKENHSDTVLQQENVVVSESAERHEESIANQNVEAIDIAKDDEVLSADVSDHQTVGEDVVPDTLYDTVRAIQQTETEAAIDRAKRALETKEQQEAADKKRLQQIKNAEAEARAAEREKIVRVGIETAKVYKDVLEAPVSEGQKLSPEELKKQYHEMLKKSTARAERYENVEVRVPKK